jgi:hypothetical protein
MKGACITMARLLFPALRTPPPRTTGVTLYTDAACRALADLLTPAGTPMPGGKVDVGADGLLPLFQGPNGAAVLYARTPTGAVTTLHPTPTAPPAVVTGSKGSNAALGSLIGVLAGEGLVVDQST